MKVREESAHYSNSIRWPEATGKARCLQTFQVTKLQKNSIHHKSGFYPCYFIWHTARSLTKMWKVFSGHDTHFISENITFTFFYLLCACTVKNNNLFCVFFKYCDINGPKGCENAYLHKAQMTQPTHKATIYHFLMATSCLMMHHVTKQKSY